MRDVLFDPLYKISEGSAMIEALLEIDEDAARQGSKQELVEELELPDEYKFLEEDPDFTGDVADTEHWHDMALVCMETYFSNKSFHCGGPIPPKMLYSAKNIALVRDSVRLDAEGFGRVVDAFFKVLHECSPLRYDPVEHQKPWDIAILIKTFREIQSYNIPKEFVPPLALLYLRFCKGYAVESDLIDTLVTA